MPIDLFQASTTPVANAPQANSAPRDLFAGSQPSQPSEESPNTSKAYSGASGFVTGISNAAEAVGGLAKNILKGGAHLIYNDLFNDPQAEQNVKEGLDLMGNYGSKLTEGLKNYVAPHSDFEEKALQNHPLIHKMADLGGYVGGLLASGNLATKPLNPLINPASDTAASFISESPALRIGLQQTAQNTVAGAAANPDHPIGGAIIGGLTGGVIGTIGGALVGKLERTNNIITHEVDNAMLTGNSAWSHETVGNIQKQLADKGVHISELKIKANLQNAVDAKLAEIRPEGFDPVNDRPVNYIARNAQQNVAKGVAESEKLYEPINNEQTVFQTPTVQSLVTNPKFEVNPRIKLPDSINKVANKDSTINDMLSARHDLDRTISKTNMLAATSENVSKDDLKPLYSLRQALQTDIQTSAEQVGLKDQLALADQHYNQVLRPFQAFGDTAKGLNKLSPEQFQAKVWAPLNRQFSARFPNPQTIKDAASALGPEGRSMVGWAKIENDYQNSFKNGMFQATTFSGRIAKGENNGLNQMILNNEHRDVVRGLTKIGLAANQYKTQVPNEGWITEKVIQPMIQHLMYNRLGLGLLKVIGSPSTPIKATRSMIGNFINTLISASKAAAVGKQSSDTINQ